MDTYGNLAGTVGMRMAAGITYGVWCITARDTRSWLLLGPCRGRVALEQAPGMQPLLLRRRRRQPLLLVQG
jgi:hypothetical protein